MELTVSGIDSYIELAIKSFKFIRARFGSLGSIISTLVVAIASVVALAQLEDWETYKTKHGKSYSNPIEETRRRAIFEQNVERVKAHNEKKLSYEMGLNHMSDWTPEEHQTLRGYRRNRKVAEALRNTRTAKQFIKSLVDSKADVPDEVDWREVDGVVSPVKNQGQCGSCWAFATTGVMEGQQRNLNISLTLLSEQNLVDCSPENHGCQGGIMSLGLSFVRKQGGLDDAKSYPYKAMDGLCKFKKENVVMGANGGAVLTEGDEELLKLAVASYGPVAVAIDATSNFQSYHGGVFVDHLCTDSESDLDHGVLVVGYGTDKKKGDFWIVKNSWGPMWGEEGYIRMARNRDNHCGIADEATLAIL